MIKSTGSSQEIYQRVAGMVGQIGCLSIVILLAAGFLGRWLDSQFNTGRSITIWLIMGSLPITLVLIYGMARMTIKKIETEKKAQEGSLAEMNKEDENDGRNA